MEFPVVEMDVDTLQEDRFLKDLPLCYELKNIYTVIKPRIKLKNCMIYASYPNHICALEVKCVL
jgi:hypothetical protein